MVAVVIHFVFAIIASVIGLFSFFLDKGTHNHKLIGRFFVIAMAISLASSFFIRSNDKFGPIHILSVLGTYWLIKSILAVSLKFKNWKHIHARNITNVYLSIIIAGAGVFGRYIVFPGNATKGYIISAIVAVPSIIIAHRLLNKYFKVK